MFTATGSMAAGRASHTMTLLGDGRVLIAGGLTGSQSAPVYSRSAELYDPSTGTFTSTNDLTTAHVAHTATLLSNGKVLVAGGFGPGALSSAEVYDSGTGTFSSAGNMTTVRFFHTSTLLDTGQVLITGSGGANAASAELY
jgi:hypothetical protein